MGSAVVAGLVSGEDGGGCARLDAWAGGDWEWRESRCGCWVVG